MVVGQFDRQKDTAKQLCTAQRRAIRDAQAPITLALACSDIKPFIPNLIHAIENPKDVIETVHKLAGTTFVQTVDYAALSIMSPLLVRGLAERSTATKRQCARIIENMTKLVDVPSDVAPFLPKLLPILEAAKVRLVFFFVALYYGACVLSL